MWHKRLCRLGRSQHFALKLGRRPWHRLPECANECSPASQAISQKSDLPLSRGLLTCISPNAARCSIERALYIYTYVGILSCFFCQESSTIALLHRFYIVPHNTFTTYRQGKQQSPKKVVGNVQKGAPSIIATHHKKTPSAFSPGVFDYSQLFDLLTRPKPPLRHNTSRRQNRRKGCGRQA